jgi:hypothetical protein
MLIKAGVGRVIVLPDPVETQKGSFIIQEEAVKWGTVIDIGPPVADLHSDEDIKHWKETGEQPKGTFQKGDKVFLPNIGIDAGKYKIYWTYDIPCWMESSDSKA